MTDEALKVVEAIANESIAEKVVAAAMETISHPDPVQLLQDIKIAVELVTEFRAKVKEHPTLSDFMKALF